MRVALDEVCLSIADGDHQAPPKSEDGIPFITISCLDPGGGKPDFDSAARVPLEYYESLADNRRAKAGDVLLSVVGSLGIPYLVKADDQFVFQRHIAILRPGKGLLPEYLYYLLKSPDSFHYIDSVAQGAAQRTLTLAQLRTMEVDIPPLDEQQRRVAALEPYDNLIENNRKQIALLEEAGQRLYKEWFVGLRFPGHETTKIIDGVPEGWQKVRLSECIETELGGGWGQEAATHEYSEIGYVIRATDISDVEGGDASSVPLRWHKPSNIRSRKLEAGDIVFEVSGGSREHGVGRSLLVTQEGLEAFAHPVICASFCKRIKPKQRLSLLLAECIKYEYSTEGLRKFEKRSAGNIINYHWKPFLSEYELLIPDERTLAIYERYADSLRAKKSKSAQIIREAREVRDRLLPKLMSGEIEVM